MRSHSGPRKLGSILVVADERLSREKQAILARTLNALRTVADLKLIGGANGAPSEDELLKHLEQKPYQLVLAPWYRYLAWTRVEAFYGLTRTNGPTFAGYFCEPIQPYELGEEADHLRAILLDLGSLQPHESILLIKSLADDKKRSGLLPLLEADTQIYCENWYSGQGLGLRMDAVMGLPEIANTDWSKRGNAIRCCLTALWSLIYEEGPGKSEFHQAITANSPKAYFQVGSDRRSLVMRLCYSMSSWSHKDALRAFWPRGNQPSSPYQLLLRHADFVRVHRIAENTDLEITAGLVTSAPAERDGEHVRSLWIEPLTAHAVSEVPFEAPSPSSSHLKLLPTVSLADSRLRSESAAQARERFIVDAAVKIRDLKKLLTERDELIRELRSGGIGTAAPLPPPDMEALLEAFQERFFDARYQIRQFELQIAEMEKKGATAEEIEGLRARMRQLAEKEKEWLRTLAATLEAQKAQRQA